MARPAKKGFDYFPLDVNILYSLDIRTGISRFGGEFVSFYIFILTSVFEKGYYVKYDEDLMFIASDALKISSENAQGMLDFMLRRSMLDETLYSQYGILTSVEIQENYQEMVKARASRRTVEVKEEFWLLNDESTKNVTIIHENEGFGEINSTKQTETKKDNQTEIVAKQSKSICKYQSDDTASEDVGTSCDSVVFTGKYTFDVDRIERAYSECTGRFFTSKERSTVLDLLQKKCSADKIVFTISNIGRRRKNANIRSLNYFIPAINQACFDMYGNARVDCLMHSNTLSPEDMELLFGDESDDFDVPCRL